MRANCKVRELDEAIVLLLPLHLRKLYRTAFASASAG